LAVVVLAAATAGCEFAKKKSPTEPTVTLVDIRITGPSALLIGQTAGYTTTATYSDSSSAPVGASWTSAAPAIAEVSAGGQLTAWTAGSTTISASFDGRTANHAVQITNPLIGQWVLSAASNPGSPSGIGTRTKALTQTDWVVEQRHPATGAIIFRHGGRYTIRGTEYSETVDFANASTASLIGRTFTATVNASANQFTQSSSGGTEEWTRIP
jgi:hypothetical protein